MRKKKILSIILAAALAVMMSMPIMAADGGVLNVDVSTMTAVLRVQVPTQMSAEVDQFETAQKGTQIAAGEFDMVNLSEVNVKVDVTSTVTLGQGISLASGKSSAENSTKSDAWLAVAAKSAENSYDDTSTAGVTENKADLSELNTNVTTFDGLSKRAEQTFYLGKGTGSTVYKLAVPSGNKASVVYAQFYELTALGSQPTDKSTLQAAVDAGDVYAVASNDNGTDGAAVTKLSKGTNVTWSGGNTYYKAAITPSPAVTDGKLYVYGGTSGNGGKAGFTYIGRLSDGKAAWTKDDIKSFKISYTITGINSSKYEQVKDHCIYGYYKRFQDMTSVLAVSEDGVVRMLIPPENFDSLYLDVDGKSWKYSDTSKGNWTISSTSLEYQLSNVWMDMVKGKTLTVTLVLKDGTMHSITADFPG